MMPVDTERVPKTEDYRVFAWHGRIAGREGCGKRSVLANISYAACIQNGRGLGSPRKAEMLELFDAVGQSARLRKVAW